MKLLLETQQLGTQRLSYCKSKVTKNGTTWNVLCDNEPVDLCIVICSLFNFIGINVLYKYKT